MSAKTKVLTKGHKQGSVDLADFHIYSTVFHADSRGAICFSKINYCSGLRQLERFQDPTSGKNDSLLISEPN